MRYAYAYAKRGQLLLCERWAAAFPKVKVVSSHPGWTDTPGVEEADDENKQIEEERMMMTSLLVDVLHVKTHEMKCMGEGDTGGRFAERAGDEQDDEDEERSAAGRRIISECSQRTLLSFFFFLLINALALTLHDVLLSPGNHWFPPSMSSSLSFLTLSYDL